MLLLPPFRDDLLIVNPQHRNGLFLIKPYHAEFAGPGSAVGGVIDRDCQRVLPVGNFSLICPESAKDRRQAYLIRRQWIRLSIQQLGDSTMPLQRAWRTLNWLEGHYGRESIVQIPDETLALIAAVLPQTIRRAREPHQWQTQWLLKEENAELRRILIQGIGYERICTELEATELDSWQEYTLLRIDNADVEPIYLLKMTCPSTGRIHVLRVPPYITGARRAIAWVNWGIDPDKFAVQT